MERRLRGAVGREEGDVRKAGGRADGHDSAASVPGQGRRQALDELEGPEVVYLHLTTGVADDGGLGYSPAERDAGVAEHDLHIWGRLRSCADLVRIGHVEREHHKALIMQVAKRLRIARGGVDPDRKSTRLNSS